MKRHKAGSYTAIFNDTEYYAVRLENGWWSVGTNSLAGSNHIEDFETYRQAKEYILTLNCS